jgi:hypothetical protein
MSGHYSKFNLNTYLGTPYFQAHCPKDYPVDRVLLACRIYHNLPENLQKLASLSKHWEMRHRDQDSIAEIDKWYDDEGYELNPSTGERMTEDAIEESWAGCYNPPPDEGQYRTMDITIPPEGFADPNTWEPEEKEPDLVDREDLTEAQILSDIASRGFKATAKEYGVPDKWLPEIKSEKELARTILDMHGKPWPKIENGGGQ